MRYRTVLFCEEYFRTTMVLKVCLVIAGCLCTIMSCQAGNRVNGGRRIDTFLDTISTALGVNEVCYPHLGCFPMSTPWYSMFRPLPKPQAPDVIDTKFYLYTRRRPSRYTVTTLPEVHLWWSGFDAGKKTFFITHGFAHDGNHTWLIEMKDALLQKYDANVFLVDWGKGANQLNYFQAASNIRVVAKEVTRLANYLISRKGAKVQQWHLIGHSLGAHTLAYAAKSLPGIARLTALDPAQPAFEGYGAEVRLDASDAAFVDVVHTNARPFIPLVGFGMMTAHGHVDYYMNGGWDQPGCVVPPPKLFSFNQLAFVHGEELLNYVACPHQRSYEYFTSSIRNGNCTFWGRRLQDMLFNRDCDVSNCSPLGIDAINYPARGSFNVPTGSEEPFCSANESCDRTMHEFTLKTVNQKMTTTSTKTTPRPANQKKVTTTTTPKPTTTQATTTTASTSRFDTLFPWFKSLKL